MHVCHGACREVRRLGTLLLLCVPGIKLKTPHLAASTFIPWALLPAPHTQLFYASSKEQSQVLMPAWQVVYWLSSNRALLYNKTKNHSDKHHVEDRMHPPKATQLQAWLGQVLNPLCPCSFSVNAWAAFPVRVIDRTVLDSSWVMLSVTPVGTIFLSK